MSSFTSPLVISPFRGKRWRLIRPFSYRIGSRYSRRVIRVPAGTLTDFASTPRILWSILPPWGRYGKPAILHDWLYEAKTVMGKPITRQMADDIFLEAMLENKVNPILAWTMHRVVRLFAWLAWKG